MNSKLKVFFSSLMVSSPRNDLLRAPESGWCSQIKCRHQEKLEKKLLPVGLETWKADKICDIVSVYCVYQVFVGNSFSRDK